MLQGMFIEPHYFLIHTSFTPLPPHTPLQKKKKKRKPTLVLWNSIICSLILYLGKKKRLLPEISARSDFSSLPWRTWMLCNPIRLVFCAGECKTDMIWAEEVWTCSCTSSVLNEGCLTKVGDWWPPGLPCFWCSHVAEHPWPSARSSRWTAPVRKQGHAISLPNFP